jgi:hypothetical protein
VRTSRAAVRLLEEVRATFITTWHSCMYCTTFALERWANDERCVTSREEEVVGDHHLVEV